MTADTDVLWRPQSGAWLELTRRLDRPPREVWPALIEPTRLAAWMGVEWLGDARPLSLGARFDYRFADTGLESRGRVLQFEPERLLEHSWFENIPPAAAIAWRLVPDGEGTRLTLTQSQGPLDDGPRTAAGWTMILAALVRSLGVAGPAPRGMDDWRGARDRYRQAFPLEALRDGVRAEVDGSPALVFRRVLTHPPAAVWAAIASPEGIARWLQARAVVEPRVGGRLELHFEHANHRMLGEVLAFDPPRRLSYTWTEPQAGDASFVTFDIAPDPAGAMLTLTHVFRPGVELADFASGWHWHLDCLDRALEGETLAFDRPRWQALQRAYLATL